MGSFAQNGCRHVRVDRTGEVNKVRQHALNDELRSVVVCQSRLRDRPQRIAFISEVARIGAAVTSGDSRCDGPGGGGRGTGSASSDDNTADRCGNTAQQASPYPRGLSYRRMIRSFDRIDSLSSFRGVIGQAAPGRGDAGVRCPCVPARPRSRRWPMLPVRSRRARPTR